MALLYIYMRIGDGFSPIYIQNPTALAYSSPAAQPGGQQPQNYSGPGVVVDISPEGWAAYANYKTQPARESQSASPTDNPTECKTCESRRYQDVSNDSSVSFQSPTHISPGQSAAMVSAHESEHVTNEQARASEEGREIVSQTVMLKTSICPECKRVYVSGGETRTVSRQKAQPEKADAPQQIS